MSFSFSPPWPPCSRAMSSSADVSMRWYPKRRYNVVIDSNTWSRTATLAGSRSLVPRAGLLSIFAGEAFLRECGGARRACVTDGVRRCAVVLSSVAPEADATTKYVGEQSWLRTITT